MTPAEPPGQVDDTFYEKLLSFAVKQGKAEIIRNKHPAIQVLKDDNKSISFCKELSREWIINMLSSQSDDKTVNEDEKKRFVELQNHCCTEPDAQIYSYFLFFCGTLSILTKKKEDKKFREAFRNFFELYIRNAKDSKTKLFFKFLKTYTEIVDPTEPDIVVYKHLKDCVRDEENHVIFDAIEKEYDLMRDILDQPLERKEIRLNKIKQVFPNEDIQTENIKEKIESIIDSRMARLYYIAGRERKSDQIAKLNEALKFPCNSFALIQAAYLVLGYGEELEIEKTLVKEDIRLTNLSALVETIKNADLTVKLKINTKNYRGASEYLFNKVIDLIDKDKQFSDKEFEPFNHRIKLEARLGLAYVYYKKNQYHKADHQYEEAEKITKKYLSNEDYLKSIILINRGRNILDNGPVESRSAARKHFEEVLTIYKAASMEIKDELAEIAARAYNNLGIYYFAVADYENAEKQFRKAISVDDTNSHAMYNLGVLYHKKKEDGRAETLFQNACSLDSNLQESREALEKLDAMKKRVSGSEWFNWWFGSQKEKKGKKRYADRLLSSRPIIAGALIAVMMLTFVMLVFYLYIQDFPYIITSGPTPELHDVDEGAFLVIFGICIIILMLPFISKLKMGGIEIDLETAGYPAVGPASMGARFPEEAWGEFTLKFFFARFWY